MNCDITPKSIAWNALCAEGSAPNQCGWLTDKFGVPWQIIPTALPELLSDPDRQRSQRAMKAMLSMTKIDIAELERRGGLTRYAVSSSIEVFSINAFHSDQSGKTSRTARAPVVIETDTTMQRREGDE